MNGARVRLAVAVALCALATSVVAPATQASPPVDAPDGQPCSYAAMSEPGPTAGPESMSGLVYGGPLVWDRDFWLHCHLQAGSAVHDGVSAAADVHGASVPHDGDAAADEVAFVAGQVGYEVPEDTQESLCTAVSWPAATGPHWRYWHADGWGDDGLPGTADDVAAHWSPDPNGPCATPRDATRPLVDVLNDVVLDMPDPGTCWSLISVHDALDPEPSSGPQPGDVFYVDAEGDVFVDDGDGITEGDWVDDLFWDCPGYVDYPFGPGADGYPVVDVGASPDVEVVVPPSPPAVHPSAFGYVVVRMAAGDAAPAYTLAGELAVPALWTCSAAPYVSTQPFTVSCDQVDAGVDWTCGAVHADVTTTSAAARARTALHCDGDATPEAQTHTVTGAGGHDSKAGPALSPVVVTQLRCTVSDGLGAAPVPGFVAGCGDPAVAGVEDRR